MREDGLTRRTLGALKWAALSAAADGVLSLLILAVLSRLLAPRDFGLLAMALIFVTLAEIAGRRGLGPALIQRAELTDRHVATGFALSAAAGAVSAAAIWGLAPLLGRLLAEPRAAPVLATLSLAVAIAGLAAVPEALLRRALRFRALAAAELVSLAFGYGAVAIALALGGFGVWALVWGTVARHAVFAAAVTAAAGTQRLRGAPGRREARDLLRTGAGFASGSLCQLVGERGAHLVLGRGLGAASLGYFTRASALASFSGGAGSVLVKVLFPAMAQRQHRPGRLADVYLQGVETLSLLALPGSVLLAVSAPEIVALVLGGQWGAAVPVLQVLAVAAPLRFCDTLNRPPTRALGAVWRLAWRQAAYAAALVLAVWTGSRWGLVGAAAGAAAARVGAYLLMSGLTLALLGLRWRRLARCHLPGLWAAAWAAPALWLTASAVREASLPGAAALGAEILAWGAAAALATRCAPAFARTAAAGRALAYLPFDALGPPGRWLRRALEWPIAGRR